MINAFLHRVYLSLGARTAVPLLLSLGVGIFSNFLVTEMTVNNKISWTSFYVTKSFYLLLFFLVLTYFFNRYLFLYEKDVLQFKEADYCVAYARSQLIPAHIEAARSKIAQGDTQSFEDAMAQVKKILK
ncbi:hypothetical protein [Acetobacter sp. UBA5411]|uniref:hypothetical protein n=1 Tax=Acetobacter sp. UBA5411 TaxID=1945905 RepID=UPI0025C40879|nr:hypothetical protein [Acetobacter sp. UBA5411]